MMKNLFKICLVAGVGFLASCGDEKGDYVKPVSNRCGNSVQCAS